MPRRRAFKISLASFVLLTVVCIASCWVSVGYSTQTTAVGIGVGAVWGGDSYGLLGGFYCHFGGWSLVWVLPHFVWNIQHEVAIPLWIPALLAGVPTFIFWRRSRRIPPGHCRACRYDLTGNTSGVCPECGTTTGDG